MMEQQNTKLSQCCSFSIPHFFYRIIWLWSSDPETLIQQTDSLRSAFQTLCIVNHGFTNLLWIKLKITIKKMPLSLLTQKFSGLNTMAAIVEGETPAANENSMSNDSAPAMEGPTFNDQFRLFAKFGDCKSTGEAITLSNSDKWMKQAKVIDKKITTTDTGIYYKMVAKTKRTLIIKDYEQFLDTLAKNKKADVAEIKQKMASCGPPATSKTTPTTSGGAVSRLTDHTKYTGTHKLRFDDTGKGRGKEGRVDKPNTAGYVQGYKDHGTYETTH